MAVKYATGLLLALIIYCYVSGHLSSAASTGGGSGPAARAVRPRRHTPGGDFDTRWRMISAMLVLKDYSLVIQNRYAAKPAILTIDRTADGVHELIFIMDKVCNLVSFYELAIKINETSDTGDFYPLLNEVITDACKWIYYLANYTNALTLGTSDLLNYTSSCSPAEGTTILEHFCYRLKAGNLTDMMLIEKIALHSYISDYHLNDNPHVPATDFSRWLNTSSLHPTVKGVIHDNTIMAILQYLIETKLL